MKSDNNTLYTNTKQVLFTNLQNDNSSSKQTQNNCFDKQTFTNTSIIFNKYTQTETSYDKSHRLSMSSVNIVSIDPNENELICKNTCGSKYSQIDFSVSTLSNESNFQNKFILKKNFNINDNHIAEINILEDHKDTTSENVIPVINETNRSKQVKHSE